MSIPEIANQVESAVKLADALGADAHAAVSEVVNGLPPADLKAVAAHIAESVASDDYPIHVPNPEV